MDYDGEVHTISGYRSPETNEHLRGKALDFRLPGVDTKYLRDIAWETQCGGGGIIRSPTLFRLISGGSDFGSELQIKLGGVI